MADSFTERERSVIIAKLADQAERYDEMIEKMKNVATTESKLTPEERNLISSAYKKKIWSRRASWRMLSSELEKEQTKSDRITEYRNKVEAEMRDICNDILLILDNHLIPSSKNGDKYRTIAAFYYMMKGDYYGYLTEIESGSAKKKAADEAITAYETAVYIARKKLLPDHPIRLSVALNYSVFMHEILGLTTSAIGVAENAYEQFISGVRDTVDWEAYTDIEEVMDLDGLNWKADDDIDEIAMLLNNNAMAWKAAKSRDAGGSNDGDDNAAKSRDAGGSNDGDYVPPFELLSMRLL